MIEPVRILALDPSTEVTGVGYVEYVGGESPRVIGKWAIDGRQHRSGEALSARLARIRYTREALYGILMRLDLQPHVVAYETDTERGQDASEALKMAAGAYLTLPWFDGLPLFGVSRQAQCIALGCLPEYRAPKGKTHAEQMTKKRLLKNAVRGAAARMFPGCGVEWKPETDADRDRLEAIADALAVTAGAYNAWVEMQRLAASRAAHSQQNRRRCA